MNRILLGLALACTTPACMHLETTTQREVTQARATPKRVDPRRAPTAFEPAPVAPSDHSDLPLQVAAGVAIALGVILYVE